jgi:hypothetical protein
MKSVAACAGVIVFALCVLIAWPPIIARMQPSPPLYAMFFGGDRDNAPPVRWHMLLYLDIHSCLTCTEDMDAWRELQSTLAQAGGELTIWSPASDSIDVAEAMRLEGIQAPVNILDSNVVRALGWIKLGTPVKVLLDDQYRLVKIAGRMGNVRASTCFFDSLDHCIHEHDGSSLAMQ